MKTLRALRPRIEEHVRHRCSSLDYNHDVDHHIIFVARDAERIAEEEGADPDQAWAAGMLHELGLSEGREGHEERSARLAEAFLQMEDCNQEEAQYVVRAIAGNQHDRIESAALLTKCLYDADQLHTLGPNGFVRVLADMIAVLEHRPRHEAMAALEDYQHQQFERLQTETGRRLARDGHRLMGEFYTAYREFEAH